MSGQTSGNRGGSSEENPKGRAVEVGENLERAAKLESDASRLEEACRQKEASSKGWIRRKVHAFLFICLLASIAIVIGFFIKTVWGPFNVLHLPQSKAPSPSFMEKAGELEQQQKEFLRRQKKLLEAIESARKKIETKKGGK